MLLGRPVSTRDYIISGQYDRLLPAGPMLSISVHCALQVRTFGRGRIRSWSNNLPYRKENRDGRGKKH